MEYAVVVESAADGSWSAFVPDLPGCVASGSTAKEARQEICEAIRLHIESLRRHGEPVPPPTTVEWDRNSSVEELVRRYSTGECEFREVMAECLDFDGVQLQGARFIECGLHSSSMRGADLRDAVFIRCNVKCVDFSGADLRGARFDDCAVCGSVYTLARVHGIDFTGSSYYGTDLTPTLGFPIDGDWSDTE